MAPARVRVRLLAPWRAQNYHPLLLLARPLAWLDQGGVALQETGWCSHWKAMYPVRT